MTWLGRTIKKIRKRILSERGENEYNERDSLEEKRNQYVILRPIKHYSVIRGYEPESRLAIFVTSEEEVREAEKELIRSSLEKNYITIGGYESDNRLAVYATSEEEALETIKRDKKILKHVFGEMKIEDINICDRNDWWTC